MPASKPDSPMILVGFDGSDHGYDAARFARLLADAVGADLAAVRVAGRRATKPVPGPGESGTVDLGTEAGALSVREIEAGSAAAGLYRVVEAERAAMLVVGATHQHGAGRLLHGSIPGRLLAGLPCPLVVVPAGYAAPGRIRVIEVGFNASPESRAALAFAADLGLGAEATLRVVAVGTPTSPDLPSDQVRDRRDLQEQLHGAVAELAPELRALPVYAHADPAAELLARAEEGVDLVVLGSRTYGPLRSVLLGSVATVVIERAPCPVVITPRPADPA